MANTNTQTLKHSNKLSNYNKETTIRISELDGHAEVWTTMSSTMTKCKSHTPTETVLYADGTTYSKSWELPTKCVTIRPAASVGAATLPKLSGKSRPEVIKALKAAGVHIYHMQDLDDDEPYRGPCPEERETIINYVQGEDTAYVDCAWPAELVKIIKKGYVPKMLGTNNKETDLWEASFEMPVNAISIKSAQSSGAKKAPSAEAIKRGIENLKKGREAKKNS